MQNVGMRTMTSTYGERHSTRAIATWSRLIDQGVPLTKVRALAPLRLGLAGGGTDLSPYSETYGGNVLNCAISLYAYAMIEDRSDNIVKFSDLDLKVTDESSLSAELDINVGLGPHRAVYNRIIRDYNDGVPLPVSVETFIDVAPGSGLGSSSALIVALVKAYAEYLNLPFGDYDLARVSYEIERKDLVIAGGRQDYYASAFGGINFMEFIAEERVIINPLRVPKEFQLEFESSLLLFHTGASEFSSEIITQQKQSLEIGNEAALEAFHGLKRDVLEMKECLLNGDILGLSEVLNQSWRSQKLTAQGISNPRIDLIYENALNAGAMAGKISGAGGGGCLMLLASPEKRVSLTRQLQSQGLVMLPIHLTADGAKGWELL